MPALTAYDLAQMYAYTVANLDGVPIALSMVTGTYIHTARQDVLDMVVQNKMTHVMFVDADMRFPKEACLRLLERIEREGKDVVGCNYAGRGIPSHFVALKKVATDKTKGAALVTNAASEGLEEVEGLGFGCVMIKVDALKKMPNPKKKPWFWYEWMPNKEDQVGEDIYFCNLLRETGVKLYVDHDLSKEVKHLGQFAYELAHAAL
jgi:hypothetical protein